MENCHFCKDARPVKDLKICSRCTSARYCNVDCQRGDWGTHKMQCKRIGAEKDDARQLKLAFINKYSGLFYQKEADWAAENKFGLLVFVGNVSNAQQRVADCIELVQGDRVERFARFFPQKNRTHLEKQAREAKEIGRFMHLLFISVARKADDGDFDDSDVKWVNHYMLDRQVSYNTLGCAPLARQQTATVNHMYLGVEQGTHFFMARLKNYVEKIEHNWQELGNIGAQVANALIHTGENNNLCRFVIWYMIRGVVVRVNHATVDTDDTIGDDELARCFTRAMMAHVESQQPTVTYVAHVSRAGILEEVVKHEGSPMPVVRQLPEPDAPSMIVRMQTSKPIK